ncbi:MAG: heme ABC exporter ATP-binding protein CcmA [Marinovum sp.]|nr:heme ABC exporter ATP-binding protein CcmA [Marinovum sp.]
MLEARDLSVSRGGVPVLTGVSFKLTTQTAMILRGPNGSGKTTLLRTLAGLQPASSGDVIVEPDTLAYAAHSDGIKATLTVTENLTFWAQTFGHDDIGAALTAFDLLALRDRAASALSAGQKRRLGLARMVVTRRPVWLLDEPTVSLDTRAVATFAHAVRAHLARGGAVLIATHIDLGFEGETLDLAPLKARPGELLGFDEAFS